MSGSSLDGLDIAYVHFQETAGTWTYEIQHTACYSYTGEWMERLENATSLSAREYQLLHAAFGNFIGEQVNRFIEEKSLQYQVQIISSHGHTTFHMPEKKMTAQLGEGASIAAKTNINVVSDLRAMDVALGGQGAPIVPIGEKLLLGDYHFFLNLGGIANISAHIPESKTAEGNFIAFDVCPANRVLNMLAKKTGKDFDENGKLASTGVVDTSLLEKLNRFSYYNLSYPKSLANEFGTNEIFPVIEASVFNERDGLRTYVEHICMQIKNAIEKLRQDFIFPDGELKLLATGGGAHNIFLVARLREVLRSMQVTIVIPDKKLVDFKEALVVALMGALRWRDENTVLASVTGASRSSVGGAVWIAD